MFLKADFHSTKSTSIIEPFFHYLWFLKEITPNIDFEKSDLQNMQDKKLKENLNKMPKNRESDR